jgi:hypothetical protein
MKKLNGRTKTNTPTHHTGLARYFRRLARSNRARPLIIVLSFVLVGTIILIATKAATPNGSLESESGTRSTNTSIGYDSKASNGMFIRFGATGDGNQSRRFFADDASWNKPVSAFGAATDNRLTQYADRFWNYAGLPAEPGDTNVHFRDYSVPIYDVSEANTTVRIFQAIWAQNQQSFSTAGGQIGDTVPWNTSWKPGTGNDRIMHIVNYDTGYNYGFWVVDEPKIACNDRNIFGIALFDGPNTKAGYEPDNPNHLCMAAYGQYTGLYTVKDGTTHNDRGMGIDKLALVTRANEVKSGAIRHALELTITSTMFGSPECSPANSAFVSGAGVDCGFYLPPSTRVEFSGNENDRITNRCSVPTQVNSTGRSKTIPEGIRIALNISDGDIQAWLNQRGFTGAKRETARIFAVALRDYGAIVGETGCFGIGIETDGLMNPTTANTWASLGITDIPGDKNPHGDLLDGLFTRQRIYVVNPPPAP